MIIYPIVFCVNLFIKKICVLRNNIKSRKKHPWFPRGMMVCAPGERTYAKEARSCERDLFGCFVFVAFVMDPGCQERYASAIRVGCIVS